MWKGNQTEEEKDERMKESEQAAIWRETNQPCAETAQQFKLGHR